MKLTPGVNFTNVLRAAFFVRRSQKLKKTLMTWLSFLGSSSVTLNVDEIEPKSPQFGKILPNVVSPKGCNFLLLNKQAKCWHKSVSISCQSLIWERFKFKLCTLCPRYRDSPVRGDPTSVLVNGTPSYTDKMLFLSG